MGAKRQSPETQRRLQKLLHEIFVAQGGGVATEAFGEANFLLHMSSMVNSGEELRPDQVAKIEEIWEREARKVEDDPAKS